MISVIDMSKIGSEGFTIALVGYAIVFIALVSLVIVFSYLPKILSIKLKKSAADKHIVTTSTTTQISGEVNAAIATALHLYFNNLHDEESNIVTIKKESKLYSPWSSKIYGINNRVNKRTW